MEIWYDSDSSDTWLMKSFIYTLNQIRSIKNEWIFSELTLEKLEFEINFYLNYSNYLINDRSKDKASNKDAF